MCEATGFGLGNLASHPGIAALLGEFTARWSLAEAVLLMPMLVAMHSGSQEVAAAMLSSTNSTEGKIKLVKAALDNMVPGPVDTAAIKKALRSLEKICEERNAVCHHTWAVDFEKNRVVTLDFRKTATDAARFTERSEQSLRDLCNRTMEAARAVCLASGSSWVDEEVVCLSRL